MHPELMNEKDLHTRKQWLVLLIITALLHPLNWIFKLTPSKLFSTWPAHLEGLLTISILLLFNFIIFHCAYTKPGTKLLTFYIVLARIMFGVTLIAWVIDGTILNLSTPAQRLGYLLEAGLDIWWYFLNLKMRTINNWLYINSALQPRLRTQNLQSSPPPQP